MAVNLFLSVPGLDGGSNVTNYLRDFELSDYSFGGQATFQSQTTGVEGNPVFNPLTITLASLDNVGVAALMGDLATGKIIPTLTLYLAAPGGAVGLQTSEAITLTNALITGAQVANGGASLSFEYTNASITPYTGGVAGTTVSATVPAGATFATPSLTPPTTALSSTVYLNLQGQVGPETGSALPAGELSAFLATNFQFSVDSQGVPSALAVTFRETDGTSDVLALYNAMLKGTNLGTLTLSQETVVAGGSSLVTQQLTLTNAVVYRYTDVGGRVTVAFGYSAGTLTTTPLTPSGTLDTANRTTVALTAPSGPTSHAVLPAVDITPGSVAQNSYYLTVTGTNGTALVNGGSTAVNEANAFDVSGFNVGTQVTGGLKAPVHQPLTVTFASAASPGIDYLVNAAATGAMLPTVTLNIVNSSGVLVDKIVLTNVLVANAQAAGGGASVSLEYSKLVETSYGAPTTTATVDTTVVGGGFASVTPPTVSNAASGLYLSVSGVLGPSTVTGFKGDFQPVGYGFSVETGSRGTAGPLVVDLGAAPNALGVAALYQDAATGTIIPTVALSVTVPGASGSVVTETVTLTDAIPTVFTNSGGDVSVSFAYKTATLTSAYLQSNGKLGTPQTVSFNGGGGASIELTGSTPGTTGATTDYLSVPGVPGGYPTGPEAGNFAVSGFEGGVQNIGTSASPHPAFQPVTVTLSSADSSGLAQLMADASVGSSLGTVTLDVVNGAGHIVDEYTLSQARIVDVQAAGGGASVSFGYTAIAEKTFDANGVQLTSTSYNLAQIAGASLAAATPPTLSAASAGALYLTVPGDPGPVTTAAHHAAFLVSSYEFTIDQAGKGTGLVVSFANSGQAGVPTLYQHMLAGTVIPSVTLDVTRPGTSGALETEQITLNRVLVGSYSESGGQVSVTFDYASASISSAYDPVTGTLLATPVTVSIAGDTPCYLRGTRILTDRGERAIESLRIGDRVITLDGSARPIRWIGRRSYWGDCAVGNRAVQPIRFAPGSLGAGLPRRALWVSPEHAMYLDGMLIPAALLVNQATIVRETEVESITYHHLEFDSHAVIYAEGAAAESFVDDESRQMFDNAWEYGRLYPQASAEPARFCAPRVEDGEELEVVRRRLAAEASVALGRAPSPPAARARTTPAARF